MDVALPSARKAAPGVPHVFSSILPPVGPEADPGLLEPLARLIGVYDRAISGCEAFDADAARAALRLLRETLALDSSASREFDALYAWCESAVDRQDFLGAARCLRGLRAAWCRAVDPFPTVALPAGLPLC